MNEQSAVQTLSVTTFWTVPRVMQWRRMNGRFGEIQESLLEV
jgi:hypothetical protein